MEQFAIAEATGGEPSTANATAVLTGPHGGERGMKDFTVPDVLMHLVGHADGVSENHDSDDPAPDEDYIVGGTGVVKALQYVLGEKANDSKRMSIPPSPNTATPTGTITPKDQPGSSAGLAEPVHAKKMSKNLLGSARKIRDRLQPALLKEANSGNELAYRRLQFLDQTLQSMIQRFEEEYPETRLHPPSPNRAPPESTSLTDTSNILGTSLTSQGTELSTNASDEEDLDNEDENSIRPTVSRHNSDVNIASRSLSMEEGRLHRLGQQMRREVLDSPRTDTQFREIPWKQEEQEERLRKFGERIESISGVDLRKSVDEEGWEQVLKKIGGNYEDLRQLQEQDPEAWDAFRVAQEKARLNM